MMKPNIRLIYYISKLSGLTSFQIDSQRKIVKKTKKSFYYFVIFGAVIQGLTVFALPHIIFSLQSLYPKESVRLLVLTLEFVFIIIKSTISYSLNLFYNNDIIRLINESMLFKKQLTKVSPVLDFFDHILIREYNVRCIAFLIQVLIILTTLVFFESGVSYVLLNLSWTVTICNHLIQLIVSTVFFYGGLMISSRFLRISNHRFELYILSARNGENIDGTVMSTEIAIFHVEQFGIFFEKFSIFTDKLFHIFGFQILLSIIASAEFTLSSVRIRQLKNII